MATHRIVVESIVLTRSDHQRFTRASPNRSVSIETAAGASRLPRIDHVSDSCRSNTEELSIRHTLKIVVMSWVLICESHDAVVTHPGGSSPGRRYRLPIRSHVRRSSVCKEVAPPPALPISIGVREISVAQIASDHTRPD